MVGETRITHTYDDPYQISKCYEEGFQFYRHLKTEYIFSLKFLIDKFQTSYFVTSRRKEKLGDKNCPLPQLLIIWFGQLCCQKLFSAFNIIPSSFVSTDIDEYWSKIWATDFILNPDLHLPEENKYIGQCYNESI